MAHQSVYPLPTFPCRICGADTKTFGFTYGACDKCTKRAIELLAKK